MIEVPQAKIVESIVFGCYRRPVAVRLVRSSRGRTFLMFAVPAGIRLMCYARTK